jgi:hypothetical protein
MNDIIDEQEYQVLNWAKKMVVVGLRDNKVRATFVGITAKCGRLGSSLLFFLVRFNVRFPE